MYLIGIGKKITYSVIIVAMFLVTLGGCITSNPSGEPTVVATPGKPTSAEMTEEEFYETFPFDYQGTLDACYWQFVPEGGPPSEAAKAQIANCMAAEFPEGIEFVAPVPEWATMMIMVPAAMVLTPGLPDECVVIGYAAKRIGQEVVKYAWIALRDAAITYFATGAVIEAIDLTVAARHNHTHPSHSITHRIGNTYARTVSSGWNSGDPKAKCALVKMVGGVIHYVTFVPNAGDGFTGLLAVHNGQSWISAYRSDLRDWRTAAKQGVQKVIETACNQLPPPPAVPALAP